MKRYLVPALAALALAACEGDDPLSVGGVECDPLLRQVTGVTGDTIAGANGLLYLDRKVGSGGAVAAGRGAEVHYTLSLTGGSVRETSCDSEMTLRFVPGVDNLIEGFAQGVIGMQLGGVRRLIVPPSLGYGAAAGHELQNDTLIFDVQLVDLQ